MALRAVRGTLRLAGYLAPAAADGWAARAFITPRQARRSTGGRALARPPHFIEGPAGPLAVWSEGEGPTVLFVHGWERDHHDMAGLAGAFAAAGYRAVSFDLTAHGRSAGKRAPLPVLAKGIAAVASAEGPVAGIVAHSIGGAASAIAMSEGLEVPRIVLVGGPNSAEHFARGAAALLGLRPARTEGMLRALTPIVGQPIERFKVDSDAAHMRAAALFLHSADDRVVPLAHAQKNAAAWPGSEIRVFDGLGHNRILQDPAVIAAALDFFPAPGE
ncbi:alpha/beta fold hydrolase [Oceanibacterium hippocampi]|nr:alpha/beta hydrolase [Oceanibacterium hippocampi]